MEPNDDGGTIAPRLWGSASVVHATVDYWDDPVDVYAVRVPAPASASPYGSRPRSEGPSARAVETGDRARQRPVQLLTSRRTAPVAACRAEAELRLPRARRGLVPRRGEDRLAVRRRVHAAHRQDSVENPGVKLDATIACDPALGAQLAAASRRTATTACGRRRRSTTRSCRWPRRRVHGAGDAGHRDRDRVHAQPDGHRDDGLDLQRASRGRFVLGSAPGPCAQRSSFLRPLGGAGAPPSGARRGAAAHLGRVPGRAPAPLPGRVLPPRPDHAVLRPGPHEWPAPPSTSPP